MAASLNRAAARAVQELCNVPFNRADLRSIARHGKESLNGAAEVVITKA